MGEQLHMYEVTDDTFFSRQARHKSRTVKRCSVEIADRNPTINHIFKKPVHSYTTALEFLLDIQCYVKINNVSNRCTINC